MNVIQQIAILCVFVFTWRSSPGRAGWSPAAELQPAVQILPAEEPENMNYRHRHSTSWSRRADNPWPLNCSRTLAKTTDPSGNADTDTAEQSSSFRYVKKAASVSAGRTERRYSTSETHETKPSSWTDRVWHSRTHFHGLCLHSSCYNYCWVCWSVNQGHVSPLCSVIRCFLHSWHTFLSLFN